MHDIEPFYLWQDEYNAADDERSPFYGRAYNELGYEQTIYNFYIHPQWDDIGSQTLYIKILAANYDRGFAIIEMMGEWNDCIQNDIMYLKRDVIDAMISEGIYHFILIGENVLNFHCSDDCYYEEWAEDLSEHGGWIAALNFRDHVVEEMRKGQLHYHVYLQESFQEILWRKLRPIVLFEVVDRLIMKSLN